MIHIIQGKKDSGKTTRLKKLFLSIPKAAGFVSVKVFKNDKLTGYDLENPATGECCALARLANHPKPSDWTEELKHGPFSFSKTGLEWAEQAADQAIRDQAPALFIDEAGLLELRGKGLHKIIQKALVSGLDIYLAVRDINVEPIKEFYGISDSDSDLITE